jgi:hypothetical protein
MGSIGIRGETGTHAQIDRECMRGYTAEDGTVYSYTDCKLVAFSHHYSIYRINGVPTAICLDLITRYRATDDRDEEWVYKSIDETMGPCETDVPFSLIQKVQCPDSEYARDWRAKVMAEKKRVEVSKLIKPGDIAVCGEGEYAKEFLITRMHGRKLVYRSEKDGREYSLPRASITSIVFNDALGRVLIDQRKGR